MRKPFTKGMIPSFLLFCLAVIYLNCNFKSGDNDSNQNNFAEEKYRKKVPKQDRIDLAIEHEFEITKDPSLGYVPRERLSEAVRIKNERMASMSRITTAVPGITWTERGPNNVAGRSRISWFDLGDAANGYEKVWVGGVGGGLWYTDDITVATPIWNKINDFFDNIAITAFAQDPLVPATMYVGTGEGWFNADAIEGAGIWKSTDGGANWAQLLSTTSFLYVQDLQFVQNGANKEIYAALRRRESPAVFGSRGLHKSIDGGTTWTQVLGAPEPGSDRISDIELAANGDLYVALGHGGTGLIYRSAFGANGINTGNAGTWVNITPDPSTNLVTSLNVYDRIEVACAPSNANIVYALFEGQGTDDVTNIKQYDATAGTWTNRSVPLYSDGVQPYTRGQAWYDLIATVDPNDANTLYIGAIDVYKSTNNGTAWTRVSDWTGSGFPYVHADIHELKYAPGSSTRLVIGCDGGIFYTSNADVATPAFLEQNDGYNVTQYYAAANHPTNANFFLAGSQDNGSQRFNAAGLNNTVTVTGGDGAFCHIDQNEPSIQITSYVRNNYFVSTDGGNSFLSYDKNNNGSFINPTDYDDAANILYCGNLANTYLRWINPATNGSTTSVTVTNFAGASIRNVTVSPQTANRVYFGLSNGSIVRVDNAHQGTSFAGTIVRPAVAGSSVSGIAIDPANEAHMLVCYSNYGVTSIFESTNATSGSPTWNSVEGNLPDMPVRWVIFDPRNSDWALIATEVGVWSTDNLNSGGVTDWDPTNTNLANVRVDMLQYSPATRVLSAATHGRGLYTALVPNVTTPDINLSAGTSGGFEQTSSTTGVCRNYRDYTYTMTIANAPTGNATINLNVSGSTAIAGVDYDLTTNGNFASPSSSFVFNSGATTAQTITLRVYNDAEIESVESFTINYSISGATDAVAGKGLQTMNVAITSDDAAPTPVGSGNATVGAGDFGSYIQPFRSNFQKSRSQYIYLGSELIAAGLLPGNFTAIGFNVTGKTSTQAYTGLTISFKHTTNNGFSSGSPVFETGAVAGYSANYSTVSGQNTLALTTPFNWDGTSNVLVEVCYDNTTASGSGDNVSSNITSDCKGVWNRTTTGTGCALAAAFVSVGSTFIRPDFTFTGQIGNPIATSAGTARNEFIGSNGTFHYFDGRNILARINGAGANFGCVNTSIFEAGTTWQSFQAGQRSQKVFDIAPTTNPANSYTIGLYFSDLELAGKAPATLRIAKSTAATMAAANASNTITVPTSFVAYGTGYLFTATFTGFSKFFLIDAAVILPVTLVDFSGRLDNKKIKLDWSTSSEINSKHFEVEKSGDGANFYTIGTVNAAGNSTSQRAYGLYDANVNEYNYYRLKMVDLDGRFTYSRVIMIRDPNAVQNLWVVNNPFTTFIDVRLAKTPTQAVTAEVLNASGARVYFSRQPASTTFHFDLSASSLSHGTYILRLNVDGEMYVSKLVKQ